MGSENAVTQWLPVSLICHLPWATFGIYKQISTLGIEAIWNFVTVFGGRPAFPLGTRDNLENSVRVRIRVTFPHPREFFMSHDPYLGLYIPSYSFIFPSYFVIFPRYSFIFLSYFFIFSWYFFIFRFYFFRFPILSYFLHIFYYSFIFIFSIYYAFISSFFLMLWNYNHPPSSLYRLWDLDKFPAFPL